MGKPNRLGRHAKPRQRKRVLWRGQDLVITRDAPGPPARAQAGRDPGPQAGDQGESALLAAQAEQLVSDALQAQVDGQHDAFAWCAAQLADRSGGRGWPRAVERELLASLPRAVTAGWRQGWQPAEVVREIGRQFGARHARMAADAAAMEMRSYARTAVDERWQAQLAALGATAWWGTDDGYLERWRKREQLAAEAAVTCALEVLYGFATLPRIGRLCPLPGAALRGALTAERVPARPAGPRVADRVRELLAQAESAESAEEAQALTARAQELLARQAMDDALLAAAGTRPAGPGRASGRRLFVDSPYEVAKADLLGVVATVNHCRTVWHKSLGLSTVVGFSGDLDAAEVLFTSLLAQAAAAMGQADPHRDDAGPSGTRSFRQSFPASYARRTGERLAEAARAAQRQAATGAAGAELPAALAARHRAVDEAVDRMFPDLTQHEPEPPDREEWLPGRVPAYVGLSRTGRPSGTLPGVGARAGGAVSRRGGCPSNVSHHVSWVRRASGGLLCRSGPRPSGSCARASSDAWMSRAPATPCRWRTPSNWPPGSSVARWRRSSARGPAEASGPGPTWWACFRWRRSRS